MKSSWSIVFSFMTSRFLWPAYEVMFLCNKMRKNSLKSVHMCTYIGIYNIYFLYLHTYICHSILKENKNLQMDYRPKCIYIYETHFDLWSILFLNQHQVWEGWGLGGRAEKVSPFSSSRGFYSPPRHTCGRKEGSFSKLRGWGWKGPSEFR